MAGLVFEYEALAVQGTGINHPLQCAARSVMTMDAIRREVSFKILYTGPLDWSKSVPAASPFALTAYQGQFDHQTILLLIRKTVRVRPPPSRDMK